MRGFANSLHHGASAVSDDRRPQVIERRITPRGELVLRRAGPHYEVIADGTFLMDTRDGRSERLLVREALAGLGDARVLVGGLGVGFSLDEALAGDGVGEVVVVELEPAVVEWARTHLRGVTRHGLDDPRVTLIVADLRDALGALESRFDAICLDVDNGPGWLVHDQNAEIYGDAGLAALEALLAPGGRLAVWAAAPDVAFERRLRSRFGVVRLVSVPVQRGPDDVIYVAELGETDVGGRRQRADR
jgi:spermidine synthase